MVNTFAVVLLLSFVLAVVFFTETAASNGGFHIELIHRESHLSPYYNNSETTFDRFRKSAFRSLARARVNQYGVSSATSNTSIESQVIPDPADGEFLMKLSIGTPPTEVLAIADTGSDLIWTQCKPCNICFKQDLPVYDPKISSTYTGLSCNSSPCQSLNKSATCQINACKYSYKYADGFQTNGTLATETFTFDSFTTDKKVQNVSIPSLVFGCGNENTGHNVSSRSSGLVGLGGGPLSLVSQLSTKIDGKFSYCLVDIFEVNSTSKLKFGSHTNNISAGKNVVSTPLVSRDPVTFYFLTLEAISVGGKRLENKPMNKPKPTQGNIIIDSGTTFTLLGTQFYNQLESALRQAIPVVPIRDPEGNFNLCYDVNIDIKLVPKVIFHFTGADVRLDIPNMAVQISNDLACLSIFPTNGFPIYGNLAQINFLVEYDLVGRKVSFAPTDCSEF